MKTKIKEAAAPSLCKRGGLRSYDWQMYALLVIPLLAVFVFSYIPMFGVIIAFKDYKFNLGILGSKWVGFDNFKFFFESDVFGRTVRNTLYMNALFIVIGKIAAIITAILLFEISSRTAVKIYQTIMITPTFISWVIVAYIVFAFLNSQYGLANRIIEKLGGSAVEWYSEPDKWPAILVIANVWKYVGMDSVIYYASMMGIDAGLFEAAEIDGATRPKIIWHIILPLLIPVITILVIMSIGGIFSGDFGLFYQVTRDVGTLYPRTDIINTFVFRAMRSLGDYGMSTAVGLLQSVVGLIMVVITNRICKMINPDVALF